MFNLPKVYMDNACYTSVSSVGMFFLNLYWLMKWVALNKTARKRLRNGNLQTVVSLLYAHYCYVPGVTIKELGNQKLL